MTHIPLLAVRDLRYTPQGSDTRAPLLDDVSLLIDRGDVVDVFGPSGGGKTTMLSAMAWLLPGVTGAMELDGVGYRTFAPAEWRQRVALLPQKVVLTGVDVREAVLAPWRLKARASLAIPSDEAVRATLDSVGLSDVDLGRAITRLSVGQAARVAFVRTVLTRPAVMLLDEAEAALDDDSAELIARATVAFAQAGGAVVRVRHRGSDGRASRRHRMSGGHLEGSS